MADARMTGADLDRLRSFVVLAEDLHFTQAAARLHLTQPTLSQQIQALERQLGAGLVKRDARGCTLTDIGRQVAAEARRLLAVLPDTQDADESGVHDADERVGESGVVVGTVSGYVGKVSQLRTRRSRRAVRAADGSSARPISGRQMPG